MYFVIITQLGYSYMSRYSCPIIVSTWLRGIILPHSDVSRYRVICAGQTVGRCICLDIGCTMSHQVDSGLHVQIKIVLLSGNVIDMDNIAP
jgi:hypothetical protein